MNKNIQEKPISKAKLKREAQKNRTREQNSKLYNRRWATASLKQIKELHDTYASYTNRKEIKISVSLMETFSNDLKRYYYIYTPNGVSLEGKKIQLKVRVSSQFPLNSGRNATFLRETPKEIASQACSAENCQRRFKKSLNPWFSAKHTKCLECMNPYERTIWNSDKEQTKAAYKSERRHQQRLKETKLKVAQAVTLKPPVLTNEQARAMILGLLGHA